MNRCRWQIGADYAYRKRLTGQGGCIAFLDTGICAHPDFNGRIVGWKDFVHNRPSPYDDCGHGTHVAGIAAGDGSMSQGRFRGVAPGCSLVVLKVLDRLGNGSIAHLCRSVDWLLANQYRYHIRVVNISLCSGLGKLHPEDSPFVKKIESLWDAGIVVVAAAGNQGPGSYTIGAPGNSRRIITVGSRDSFIYTQTARQHFSGEGPTHNCICKPDLIAPGARVTSCHNGAKPYIARSGTSMSAPMVAGAIALCLEAHPEDTPKKIKIRLKQSSTDLHLPHYQQGWGFLSIRNLL